ncbi:MAG TPA: 16S rRNA (cytosine(1402)-N(4))-methyltransferase RsmH [Candidatus Saccharimonadales bacterium]|nr:16S rRNA (cytosine(1402)-N(4))-methyltransferase RsmH [Candidatus Saccharimonadales bacterium]
MHQNKHKHIPVLLDEVLKCLAPNVGEKYLDLTAGYGGHASAILERTLTHQASVLVDRDQSAIDAITSRFKPAVPRILHEDFLTAAQRLRGEQRQFDLILADLGVSSIHLDAPDRGFSINLEGPLDMRMDQRQGLTAATIVNEYGEDELAGILRRYGEEPKARRIARLIIERRPISSTAELAAVVLRAWPGRSRVHPATRTFQALRMAVNDELGLLEKALPLWLELLTPGGRIAVISFHSLEDRLVKQMFAERSQNVYEASLQVLTRHPVTASPHELVFNPRARSAKLRAAVKIKNRKEL